MEDGTFKLTIPGRVRIKKNGKRIFRTRFGVRLLSSEQYSTWEKTAVRGLFMAWAGRPAIARKIQATFRFYFINKQNEPDTSNCIEGPADALQLAGVIANDRQIYKIYAEKIIDKNQPERTEIELKIID